MAKKSSAKKPAAKRQTKKQQAKTSAPPKKRKPKSTTLYPLLITANQFESLRYNYRIKPKLKVRIQEASSVGQPTFVSRDDLIYLYTKLCERDPPIWMNPNDYFTLLDQVIEMLDEIYGPHEAGLPASDDPTELNPNESTPYLFQFKITLRNTAPAIWRRIQVPDCDLQEFHLYIQAAFGWENYHLHQFLIDGCIYGMRFDEPGMFGSECEDETCYGLAQLVPQSDRPYIWMYEYDFGDGWQHDIEFEGCLEPAPRVKYPRCVDGARACPPEDCGGVWGYAHLLAALSDPDNSDYEEMLGWCGEIDPEDFSAPQTTKEMQTALKSLRE